MKRIFLFFIVCTLTIVACKTVKVQKEPIDNLLPVRGFCIAAPTPRNLDSFIVFINQELAPRKVNTLILRVDFNYQYASHPELRDSIALSKEDVKKIVASCRGNKIRLIPQVNLLGHQSWASHTNKLLAQYPQLDETPWVITPAKYKWPNDDNLYCRSYCPLHPDVHAIVFSLVDEICDVFETDAFHAGMDEVFYLGEDKCPRCGGKNKAELFAGEVKAIRDHLAASKKELWIWGDRLIDGKTTGIGMWEASYNDTWHAIDMIPKDVVICDWHYERADKTPVYFAMKGFRVITCPWRNPSIAVTQMNDMIKFRQESTNEMKPNFYGMMQTVWSGSSQFMKGYYEDKKDTTNGGNTQWGSFRGLYKEISKL
ncbi:MAG: family 20 glycosylhydrolase [Chitinophagaceae bacterium]